MNFLDPKFLFASLFWSSVGVGYFIYGKKQETIMPVIGGILMIAVSCVVGSVVLMSLICVGLIVGVHLLIKRGF